MKISEPCVGIALTVDLLVEVLNLMKRSSRNGGFLRCCTYKYVYPAWHTSLVPLSHGGKRTTNECLLCFLEPERHFARLKCVYIYIVGGQRFGL